MNKDKAIIWGSLAYIAGVTSAEILPAISKQSSEYQISHLINPEYQETLSAVLAYSVIAAAILAAFALTRLARR